MTESTQTSRRQRVREALLNGITAGRSPIGSKLPPIRTLARQFEVSTQPVVQALDDLESQGYIRRRAGSGIEVVSDVPPLRMQDAIMLCLEAGEHLFGELTSRMAQRLMIDGMMPSIVDVGTHHQRTRRALRRALASDAQMFVVHGQKHFPFEDIVPAARVGRKVIGLVDWHTEVEVPGVHRVLADHDAGGRIVADRLWQQGHRVVLAVGPDLMIEGLHHGRRFASVIGPAFASRWRELGGELETVGGRKPSSDEDMTFDSTQLRQTLERKPAPTAVFGLNDYAVACARSLIQQIAPQAASNLAWVGYGHTAWSYVGPEPFPSVDLNLGLVAEHAVEAIEAVRRGDPPAAADPVWVQPEWAEPRASSAKGRMTSSAPQSASAEQPFSG